MWVLPKYHIYDTENRNKCVNAYYRSETFWHTFFQIVLKKGYHEPYCFVDLNRFLSLQGSFEIIRQNTKSQKLTLAGSPVIPFILTVVTSSLLVQHYWKKNPTMYRFLVILLLTLNVNYVINSHSTNMDQLHY